MPEPRKMTLSELRTEILPLVPEGIEADAVAEGVALALVPASERTLPLVRNPFDSAILYAWSEGDASATKLALNLLAEIGHALLSGHAGLLNLGIAAKEVVAFLIDLKRHHVRVTNPLQIKVLMLLRDAKTGLSSEEIATRLGKEGPKLGDIEQALDALAHADSQGGERPLVRADRMIWKLAI